MRKELPLLAALAAVLPAQPPQASAIATDALTVRGRCVDFATGAPLARCRVRLTGHQSTGYPIAWSRADWADPPELTTAADGTFRFDLRLPAADEELDRGRFHVNAAHPPHAAWFSHCALAVAVAAGGVDYGDVRLPAGVRPRIRCEDFGGALQPGVLFDLRPKGEAPAGFAHVVGDGPHWWIQRHGYGRTDVDGHLHLEHPLPPGSYTLRLPERTARALPDRVELPRTEPIVAVVAPPPPHGALTGRLVDDTGQGVEGAHISVGEDGPIACTTRRDGTFTLVANEPVGPTAALHLALNRRFDGWAPLGSFAWGGRDLELVVPSRALHTFVVRTARGTPVEDFNLYCRDRGATSAGVRLAGTFPGGRADARLRPGDHELLVVPRSARLLATGWRPLTIDATQPETTIVVDDATERVVEVRFEGDGKPAPGLLVEAIRGGEVEPFAWVPPATILRNRATQAGDEPQLIASARTDANGRASLWLADPGSVALRISGPGVRTTVRAPDAADGTVAKPIALARGATLLGTIGPVSALRALHPDPRQETRPSIYAFHSFARPTLTVVASDGERFEGVRIDPAGRFRCDGLPPGAVELRLQPRDRGWKPTESTIVLGTFTVQLEQPQQVDLQLPASGR